MYFYLYVWLGLFALNIELAWVKNKQVFVVEIAIHLIDWLSKA